MDWGDVADIVASPAAFAVFPLAVLWLGVKGKWMFTWVHDRIVAAERERAEEWKDIAVGTLPIAEKAVDVLERRRR